MALKKGLGTSYSPLYFLAALGNGGLAVSFFIYLMFMVPHPETPIVTFDALLPYITSGNPLTAGLVLAAMVAIVIFAVRHFWLLIWNLREYAAFKRTPAYQQLRQSNAEVSLMAIPLTLAMSVNVSFVLGGVFVPGLWNWVEYIFPLPLLAFTAIGIYALRIFGEFFARALSEGSIDCSRNNNLSQMIAVFAFAMVGVGFAAPSAMSHSITTAALGTIGSIFFISAAILLGTMQFVLGFRSMMEHGVSQEMSASLWIIIPILTLIGITFVRLSHGLHHHFGSEGGTTGIFIMLTAFVSLQALFGGLGYLVMKQVGYYQTFISGPGKSVGSYALICPGVAAFVLGMFFLHPGLVAAGVVAKFGIAYFILLIPLVLIQAQTIRVMLRLDRKLLRPETSGSSMDKGQQVPTAS
jgi:hypothetical protein